MKGNISDWFGRAIFGPYYQPQRQQANEQPGKFPLDECLYWGRAYIHRMYMDPHSIVVGTTRSGKTWTLRMLARSALLFQDDATQLPIDGELKSKAIFYDGKNEILPLLPAMGIPTDRIFNLNPYEQGCYRWIIADDIKTHTQAYHVAKTLFPDKGEGGENAFFPAAARDLLTNVMYSFILDERPDWTLYDVLKTLLDPEAMKSLFEKLGYEYIIQHTGRNYLTMDHKTLSGVIANISQFILPLWPIACLWENQKLSDKDRKLSLRHWVYKEDPAVLVLSRKGDARTLLDAFNEVLLSRINDFIQGHEPLPHQKSGMDESPRLWLFFDELHLAGKLNFLPQFITMAAGQGCRIVLAFQDINSLHELYGKEQAELMANMCGNLAGLRVTSFESATWLSKRFGNVQYLQHSYNSGTSTNPEGENSSNEGTTTTIQENPWIPNHWFQNEVQITTDKTGLTGAYRIAGIKEENGENKPLIWKDTVLPHEILLYGGNGQQVNPEARPETDQRDPYSKKPPEPPSNPQEPRAPAGPQPPQDKPKQPRLRRRTKRKGKDNNK